MRSWRIKGLLVFFIALGLVASTISILPAARSATANCITKCNVDSKPFKEACRLQEQACNALCKELADPTDCIAACTVARVACDDTAAFIKAQCQAACPRGQNESPSDPLP